MSITKTIKRIINELGDLFAQKDEFKPLETMRCITSAGHYPLPAPMETGLPCTCDSKIPEFIYGGTTGPIPPMPDWADPRLKRSN